MDRYIQVALNSADKSLSRYHKHGAVCVVSGRVVSTGCNYPSGPHLIKVREEVFFKYELSCHAEVAAIQKLPPGTNMRKVRLIVVRTGMKMSKPCSICEPVLRELGINKIYYSCEGQLVRMSC